MNFASPLLLLGLVGAAVPLVIHLIGRRRAPHRPFAALAFLLLSNQRVARRMKLRQWLLLAVRMLLVGGAAAMLAKPFLESESDLPAVGPGPRDAVLVLDDSLSMSRRDSAGAPLLARARSRALELVDLLGPRSRLALLTLTRPAGPLPTLTRDLRKLRTAIAGIGETHEHAQVTAALIHAARVLSERPGGQIYLISDMAAHGWPATPVPLPPNVKLHPVAIGDGGENLALVSISAAPSSAPGPRSTRIAARICNHSPRQRQTTVTLQVDGKRVARGLLTLAPRACETKAFQHTFPHSGVHQAAVSLPADALTADNQRFLSVEVASATRVLLVNGSPSPVRHRDELFYLELALNTAGTGGQLFRTRQVTAGELLRARFEGLDVVVLCNVARVPDQPAAVLSAFVRRGGGLLVSLGDTTQVKQLNRSLKGLLPQPLRGPVSAGAPGSDAPALRIGRANINHAVLSSIWSEETGGGLRSARFHRVYRLVPVPRASSDVVLWYDDGSPALVEARRGQGLVLLFTSTLDRDWTDLPIRPGYLPLVQQMVRYLGRSPLDRPGQSIEVGQSVTVAIPRGTRQLRLRSPGGGLRLWSAAQVTDDKSVEARALQPGFYTFTAVGADGAVRALERQSFAANVNPRESDLRPHKPPAASGAQQGKGLALRRVELWHGLGLGLLLLLALEAFLIRRG